MANNGPNSNGSQFFITYDKQPTLDMRYTVIGKYVSTLFVEPVKVVLKSFLLLSCSNGIFCFLLVNFEGLY